MLNYLVGSPLEQRQREWANHMADAIRELLNRPGFTIEQLRENPNYVDAVIGATGAAVRTRHADKRRVLRNAVINTALPSVPDETTTKDFIGLIDRFNEWHVLILKRFKPAGRRRAGELQAGNQFLKTRR